MGFLPDGPTFAATSYMDLPIELQSELLPFINYDEPTPKDELIVRILESYDEEEKRNLRSVLNLVFAIPAKLFFMDGDRLRFA